MALGTDLVFVNQGGGRSAGHFTTPEQVAANDWNLTAEIQDNGSILRWSNGAVWRKLDLSGTWHEGDLLHLSSVYEALPDVVFVNQGGGRSAGRFATPEQVAATDWNLTATVEDHGSILRWSNGAVWRKLDLSGTWHEGNLLHPSSVSQSGPNLIFVNQGGGTSAGRFAGPDKVKAIDWNLTAEVQENGSVLRWSNGAVWRKLDLSGTWHEGDLLHPSRILTAEQDHLDQQFVACSEAMTAGEIVDVCGKCGVVMAAGAVSGGRSEWGRFVGALAAKVESSNCAKCVAALSQALSEKQSPQVHGDRDRGGGSIDAGGGGGGGTARQGGRDCTQPVRPMDKGPRDRGEIGPRI
jgi:hypothetical protein